MRNVEVKARCADLAVVRARAEGLGARPAGAVRQRDTFFAAPRGRLKLRTVDGRAAELIAYRRDDAPRPRGSEYAIYTTADAAALSAVLAEALGEVGAVEKRREVWLWRRTRIHLDDVCGLGAFVELETVLGAGDDDAGARAELDAVAAALGLAAEDFVARAYVDLGAG